MWFLSHSTQAKELDWLWSRAQNGSLPWVAMLLTPGPNLPLSSQELLKVSMSGSRILQPFFVFWHHQEWVRGMPARKESLLCWQNQQAPSEHSWLIPVLTYKIWLRNYVCLEVFAKAESCTQKALALQWQKSVFHRLEVTLLCQRV